MEDQAMVIKAGITTFCAALTILWGWFGWLVVGLIVAMTADYFTGWLKARNAGEWKSCIAKKGLTKKVAILGVVMVAGMADLVMASLITNIPGLVMPFTYSVLICPIVVVWYLLAELGSILENCSALGAKQIPFLSKLINMLKTTIEKTGDKILPDTEQEGTLNE